MSEEISADGAKISQTACKAAGDKTGGVLGDTWDLAKEAFSEGSDKYDIVVKEDKLVWRKYCAIRVLLWAKGKLLFVLFSTSLTSIWQVELSLWLTRLLL